MSNFMFQSPRSGKFVSNDGLEEAITSLASKRFNPLDRGNLYLMRNMMEANGGFLKSFQSPRSGKFVSNKPKEARLR